MSSVSRAFLLPLLALALTLSGCATGEPASTSGSQEPRAAHGQRSTPAPTETPAEPAPSPDRSSSDRSSSDKNSAGKNSADKSRDRRERTGSRGKHAPLLPLRRVRLDQHLLAPDRMPGMGTAATWQVTGDGPEDTRRAGTCQKTSLGSIGAVSAVRRTFAVSSEGRPKGRTAGKRTHPTPEALQVVAKFADGKSAWRAHQVLAAWREDCAERLEHPRREVGPMRSIGQVQVGTGENYLAEYGPKARDRGWAAGFGIVRTGNYLSIVEVRTGATGYPSERDPARVAVRRIARTFS